jgi:excisionase family DNA binding protein
MNQASDHSQRYFLQNELLTVREVALYLRVSRVTAWRWCQEGIIPAFRIGRSWRIRRDDLLELEKNYDHRSYPPDP